MKDFIGIQRDNGRWLSLSEEEALAVWKKFQAFLCNANSNTDKTASEAENIAKELHSESIRTDFASTVYDCINSGKLDFGKMVYDYPYDENVISDIVTTRLSDDFLKQYDQRRTEQDEKLREQLIMENAEEILKNFTAVYEDTPFGEDDCTVNNYICSMIEGY